MQRPCKELKRIARLNLTGNYNLPMGAFVTATAIAFMIELPFSYVLDTPYATLMQKIIYYIAEFLISIIAGVFDIGLIYLHLNIARHKEAKKSDIFFAFKNKSDRFVIGSFITLLLEFISILPLGIGYLFIFDKDDTNSILVTIGLGIASATLYLLFKTIFCFIFNVMLDYQDMKLTECFKLSVKLIKGNFFRAIYIYLSFIGMFVIGVLSFGIGFLWIIPYYSQTLALFYLDIVGQLPNLFISNSSQYKRLDYRV